MIFTKGISNRDAPMRAEGWILRESFHILKDGSSCPEGHSETIVWNCVRNRRTCRTALCHLSVHNLKWQLHKMKLNKNRKFKDKTLKRFFFPVSYIKLKKQWPLCHWKLKKSFKYVSEETPLIKFLASCLTFHLLQPNLTPEQLTC